MKTTLFTLVLVAFAGMVWGQEAAFKIKEDNTPSEILLVPKNSVSQTEDDTVNDKIKKIIAKDNSDSTEIGFFHIRKYAIVFKARFPIHDASNLSITSTREHLDSLILNKKFYKKVSVTAEKNLTAILTKKINRKKIQDTIVFAKKGEEFNLDVGYIDSVAVAINEGVIEHIRVFTKGGKTFSNTSSPIPLITIEKRFNDKLYDSRDGSFIFLKDAVYFEANRRFNYFPENSELKLKNTFKEDGTIVTGSERLIAENGINSLVNLQVYSDLLGVFGNEANGIIQFEANSKFYLHRGSYNNKYIYKPFDAIEPFFHFSRIDSKFDTITVSGGKEVNRIELFRRYTYAVGLDVNLLRADFRPHNSFEIKLGYMYSSSNLNVEENKLTAGLHTPYGELALKSKKLNNFALDIRARYLLQKMNPNEYISNDEWNQLVSFRAGISYFPNKKKSDKIFLRFINYLNLSDRKEDFSLLQLGFSKTISL